MNCNKKIRFAVLGCGHIGKRHAAILSQMAECDLVGLADTRAKNELSLAEYPVPFYNGIEELLNSDPDFDVLSIATPNGLHEEHAIKGLNAGKHVIIEKPMALTAESCEAIIRKAKEMKREVFCIMQNRYSPAIKWLKQIVESGKMGSVYMVQVNCFWNRDERYYKKGSWHGTKGLDGGVLYTQFSHFIDILYMLFGDMENIQTRLNNWNHIQSIEIEDTGMVMFEFSNGGMGNINFTTAAWDHNIESSITILAECGTVKVSGQYMDKVDVCAISGFSEKPVFGDTGLSNHQKVFQDVADVLNGKKQNGTSAANGKKVVEIIESMYQSVSADSLYNKLVI